MRIGLLLILIVFLPSTRVEAQVDGNPAAKVFTEVGIDQKLDQGVPLDLPFRNEEGEPVLLSDYFGSKPVILSLVYYRCPMLCNQVLNGMVETFRTLEITAGKEFVVVTVSIDPAEGYNLAGQKKIHYVEEYGRAGVERGWHFLTGDSMTIEKLADAVGFRYVYDEEAKQFAHASGIMVLTPEGKLARYLYGIEYAAKDLRFSLMEASKNRIGSPVDKLMLLCYHYNPMTGKYGVLVGNLLRGGGIVTIVILAGYIIVNLKRDRKKFLHQQTSMEV